MKHGTLVRWAAAAAVLTSLTFVGCALWGGTAKKGRAAAELPPSKLTDMAKDVAAGVGSVQMVEVAGDRGPLILFEEYHTSKVGRLQTAVMLLRLREKYGLRKIGLEGAIYSGRRLDASWFHGMGGAAGEADREDLSVRWLAEGEISPPEFMALAYSDVETYGVESAEEYSKQPDPEGWRALNEHLLAIAEQSLSDEDDAKIGALLQKGDKEGAFKLLSEADPWVKDQYEALKNRTDTTSEEKIERRRAIQSKAKEEGVEVSAASRAALQKDLDFHVTASQRSETMVKNMLRVPDSGGDVPAAILIGAAHTEKMAELLSEHKVAYAVVRANDFNPKVGSLTGEQFERKSAGKWARNSPGTLAKILNARNPPPVIERASGRAYASMNMAGQVLAHAARGGYGGGKFPDKVWPILAALPDLRVDRDSIKRDGYDVIYRAWLMQDDRSEKEAWGQVGTLSNKQALLTKEQKLLQAAADLKPASEGGSIIPPTELPGNSTSAEGEGPRDAARKGLVISRTGRDTLAVYAAKREDLAGVGKISD